MGPTIERQTMRKVYLRLLPLAMLVYFFCYLDRINVSFAALQMNADIGLTAAAYGLSSTAFYIGYCLFEVPSNVILDKVGARIWIARIMITWGLVSGATAFATGPISFLTIRLLLGFAEAGLFPGIVLLFTYWFPDHHRARIVSSFTLALPISVALGAPVSTAILGLDGWLGYAGWKWIFLLEAVPTIVIGIVVLFALTDKPAKAAWLNAEEKNWLISTLDHERRLVEISVQIQHVASAGEPEDRAAVDQLPRHRDGEPGAAAVRAADHQVARHQQHGHRLCDDARLRLRRDQHDGVGLDLRPDGGTAVEPVLGLHAGDHWPGDCRHDHGDLVGVGRHVHRNSRFLRHQGPILVDAIDDAHRRRGGGRHRLDQLDRQCGRRGRTGPGGLDQGCHRQLFRRSLWLGGVHRRLGAHRRIRPAHPAPGAGTQPRRRGC